MVVCSYFNLQYNIYSGICFYLNEIVDDAVAFLVFVFFVCSQIHNRYICIHFY